MPLNGAGTSAPTSTYHFRLVGTNSVGTSLGGDLTFATAGSSQPVPFNVNGTIQLSGGAFQLSFTNLSGLDFTVLGAVGEGPPGQYQFTDTQATNYPQRSYRVRSP